MIESRRMRLGGHPAHEDVRIAYEILVTAPEVKRPLGRLRNRQEDNIQVDLKEIECDNVDWIYLVQDGDQ
jgi:hypothetical protein